MLVDAVALFLLAAEQRDAFAVLAHARQRVADSASAWFLSSETCTKRADRHDRAEAIAA
jgi:hypothetical protein